jgi:predicted GIY-YIG superfamily endonuclease
VSLIIYILECADGSYYVGHTDDLPQRLADHESGRGAGFTRTHLPIRVVYTERHADRRTAAAREVQLKG